MRLISISAAWVFGIFLGSIFSLPAWLVLSGLLPLSLVFIIKKHRTKLIIGAICLAAFFGAAYYCSTGNTLDNDISYLIEKGTIELKGTISAPPDVRDNTTQIELDIGEYYYDGAWQKCQGVVLLFVPRYPGYQYGDLIWLKGKLQEPGKLDNFDYQAYLAQRGIQATVLYPEIKVLEPGSGITPLSWVYSLREALSRSLSRALPEPQASLSKGIVLGMKSTIPESLKTSLSITGTSHLLAISGINLSIIAGIFISLGIWIWGRRYSIYIWVSLFIVWLYALLTGMQAPVIRAAIMATMFLIAELLGRQKSALPALAFSAAVMVGVNPQILWSVSFQFSFVAILGLILIAPHLQNWSLERISAVMSSESFAFRPIMIIIDSLCITIAALLAVWPLIAYYFHTVSLISPLATLAVAPALPAIIVTGIITAIAGLISGPAAQIIGWTSWFCLSYMLVSVNFFASIPLAYLNIGQISKGFVWSLYVILTIIVSWTAKVRILAHQFIVFLKSVKSTASRTLSCYSKIPKKLVITPLLAIALMTSVTAATMPDSSWHISILDVKEGDAILIQYGSQDILIDGGPSPHIICQELSEKMPFWDRTIDLLVLTHPHTDHLTGLVEVLHRYHVNQVLAPNLISELPVFKEWQNQILTQNIKCTAAIAGQNINLAPETSLKILSPPDLTVNQKETDFDDNGLVIKLTIREVSFLFMADTGIKTEDSLINRRADLNATVLKVAHHGSSTSTSINFLSAVHPQIACISVGADNLYNHPDQKVLSRLQNCLGLSGRIYRTDKNGTIEFITDGIDIRVKTEK